MGAVPGNTHTAPRELNPGRREMGDDGAPLPPIEGEAGPGAEPAVDAAASEGPRADLSPERGYREAEGALITGASLGMGEWSMTRSSKG